MSYDYYSIICAGIKANSAVFEYYTGTRDFEKLMENNITQYKINIILLNFTIGIILYYFPKSNIKNIKNKNVERYKIKLNYYYLV